MDFFCNGAHKTESKKMIIIVDGYNVLKQFSSKLEINEQERRAFATKLGRYAKRKDHKVILVFDGGSSGRPSKEKIHGVELVYSGFKQTADEFIIEYIEMRKKGRMLLVSSDYELCLAAQDLQVTSINAMDFYPLLAEKDEESIKKKVGNKLVKTSKTEHPELDALMQQASMRIPKKEEDREDKKMVQKMQKLSKEEKRLMQKVKKL